MATDCRDFLYFQLQKEAILKNMQHVLATSQYPMQVNRESSHASDSVYLLLARLQTGYEENGYLILSYLGPGIFFFLRFKSNLNSLRFKF